jgi:hypothetical protein
MHGSHVVWRGFVAFSVAGAAALACEAGPGAMVRPPMGAACTCGYDAAPAGDWLCGPELGPCAHPLSCIDGVCTTYCQLGGGDGGDCPFGYVCRQTAHSNLAIYCAPVEPDAGE